MAEFTLEPTHYVLHFDDLPAKGLEVTVRAGTVRERLAFDAMRFAEVADVAAVQAKEKEILKELARRMVDWNLKAASTLDALMDLEDPVAVQIVEAWIAAITNGGDELGKDSTPGPDPREASLPMESLSPNPSS